jgi:hypothetical protein
MDYSFALSQDHQLPTIVALKRDAGSKTWIAFTSNDKWSTMAIIHFPPNMHASSEIQNDNTDSKGDIENYCADCPCAESQNVMKKRTRLRTIKEDNVDLTMDL